MRKLVKKGINVFINLWLFNIVHFLFGIYIVHEFGAEGKGIISIYTAGASFLASILIFGLDNAFLFYIKKKVLTIKRSIRILLINTIITSFFASLLLYFGRNLLWSNILNGVDYDNIGFIFVVVYTPIVMLTLFLKVYFLGVHDVKNHRVLLALSSLLMFLLTYIAMETKGGNIYLPLFCILIADLSLSVYYLIKLSLKDDKVSEQLPTRHIYRYGLKSYLNTLGNSIFVRADYFMIIAFVDVKMLGYYSIANFFYQAVLSIPQSLSGLLFGMFSESSKSYSAHIALKVFYRMFFILFIVVGIVVVIGRIFIPIVYGTDFIVSLMPFYILMISVIFIGSTSVFKSYFMGIGKPEIPGKITIISGVIKLTTSIILIKYYGIIGAAISFLASGLIIMTLRLYYFKKNTKKYDK